MNDNSLGYAPELQGRDLLVIVITWKGSPQIIALRGDCLTPRETEMPS